MFDAHGYEGGIYENALMRDVEQLERELVEATKQRDALAVALRALMFDSLRFRIEPSDDAYKNAESSLAALEGRGSSPAQKSPPTTP
jgi:hypothetical protein